jgi:prephenate dehydratase
MDIYPLPARRLVAEMSAAAAAAPERALAFQGAPGANSHLAAMDFAADSLPLPCFSFEDALDAVREGRADRAIIPIENSLHGRVADMHFLLPESGLSIVDEYFLPIHHCLMGLDDATPVSALRHSASAAIICAARISSRSSMPIPPAPPRSSPSSASRAPPP